MLQSPNTVTPCLSVRRGKPDLQYLGCRHSSRPSTSTYQSRPSTSTNSFKPSSSISSLNSSRSYPTGRNASDSMSIPPTPTEVQWYAGDVTEFVEDCGCCDPLYTNGLEAFRGLGLGVEEGAMAVNCSEKLHDTGGLNGAGSRCEGQLDSSHHHEYCFPMPPTPPSHGEGPYYTNSPAIHSQEDWNEFDLDSEVFGSLNQVAPPTQPIPPKGRRTTLLSRVFPQKLRDSLMRRSSATSTPVSSHSQTVPHLTPLKIPPYTPPAEEADFFWPLNTIISARSNSITNPDYEFELPIPNASNTPQAVYSPLQSPRSKSSHTEADIFSGVTGHSLSNETPLSPLQPPTITPLVSPYVPNASEISLNTHPTSSPEDLSVPTIDPLSPRPGRKLSEPIEIISETTITHMILGMQKDEEAYNYMIERMKGHGWSTPQEIKNLELQREESKQKWQLKIKGAQRVLAGLHKCGYPAYQFSERSTRSLDSVRSDYTTYMRPCIDAGPEAKFYRTYSR